MDTIVVFLEKYFQAFQSVFIILAFLASAYAVYRQNKSTKITNLITITNNHRSIWTSIINDDDLKAAAREKSFNPEEITDYQEMFIKFLIFHLFTMYEASKSDAIVPIEQVELDVSVFMSLPGPNHVWQKIKKYQNADFRNFIDKNLEK